MHQKRLLHLGPKPSTMSSAGVYSSHHDHSSSSSPTGKSSSTQPPPEWIHPGVQAPTAGNYAPAPSMTAPASSTTDHVPPYLSSTPLEVDAVWGTYDQMSWNQRSGYDQRLVDGQSDMRSTSARHQVPTAGYSSQGMVNWQTATGGYGSTSTLPYSPCTLFALGDNSAHAQPYPAEPFYHQGAARAQLQARAWGTGLNGNMWGAPVSFAQQSPASVTPSVHSHVVGDNWRGPSGTMGMSDPGHHNMPAPAPLRHIHVFQQSLDKGAAEPSASLSGLRSRKRRRDTAVDGPSKNGTRVDMLAGEVGEDDDTDADGSTDEEGRALKHKRNGYEGVARTRSGSKRANRR